MNLGEEKLSGEVQAYVILMRTLGWRAEFNYENGRVACVTLSRPAQKIFGQNLHGYIPTFKLTLMHDLDGGSPEEKKKTSEQEFDDEYLPACCRNGQSHKHPV